MVYRQSGRGGRTVAHPTSPVVESPLHHSLKMRAHDLAWSADYPADVEAVVRNRVVDVLLHGANDRKIGLEIVVSDPGEGKARAKTATLLAPGPGQLDELCWLATYPYRSLAGLPMARVGETDPHRVIGANWWVGGDLRPLPLHLSGLVTDLCGGHLHWETVETPAGTRALWVTRSVEQLALPFE